MNFMNTGIAEAKAIGRHFWQIIFGKLLGNGSRRTAVFELESGLLVLLGLAAAADCCQETRYSL
jgi:hypothetical protein